MLSSSDADLWGGKLAAALDRQHPRDLFDARGLLDDGGLTPAIREAFVVYLLSHDRPTHEVLAVTRKDIAQEFRSGFAGMTIDPVPLESLLETRERLATELVAGMPKQHQELLASFQLGKPDWDALPGVPHVKELPAIRWKDQNLATLLDKRRAQLAEDVRAIFAAGKAA